MLNYKLVTSLRHTAFVAKMMSKLISVHKRKMYGDSIA